MSTRSKKKKSKPGVDPRLIPFIEALAEMLVAQEQRLAEARRVVQAVARPKKPRARKPR